MPPDDNLIDLIAAHYISRNAPHRAREIRTLSTRDAVLSVLADLAAVEPVLPRLDARISRITAFLRSVSDAAKEGTAALYATLREMPPLDGPDPGAQLALYREHVQTLANLLGQGDGPLILSPSDGGLWAWRADQPHAVRFLPGRDGHV